MTALGIMGLLPDGVGKIASGSISFAGEDLATADDKRLRNIRGNEISMIFQEPMTSLNPVYTIGEQIAEVLRAHQGLSRQASWSKAIELWDAVRIPNPQARVSDYPFQMSGGQRQRVMIAIALACEPKILIADEPTTALDVSVQAQILDLLKKLCKERGTSIILVTHDMGVIAETTDRVGVLYAGRLAEIGNTREVLTDPKHHYTRGLVESTPRIDSNSFKKSLFQIPGSMPKLDAMPSGCAFHPRCAFASDICTKKIPPILHKRAACWLLEDGEL